jgi:hypothetical protein
LFGRKIKVSRIEQAVTVYLYKYILDCRLTGSPPLIKLLLGTMAVAMDRGSTFVIGCELAEKGGPNHCFGIAQSIA